MIGKRKSPDSETVLDTIIESAKILKFPVVSPQTPYQMPRKLRVPPSTIPILSKSTTEIIESLRNNLVPAKSSQVLVTSLSATEKFKHLLGGSRSLPLPSHCQVLLKLFQALDATIFYAHMKKKSTLFENIQASIEQTYSQNCKIQQVQQILKVYPKGFQVEWVLLDRDYALVIDFPEKNVGNDEIAMRKVAFFNAILAFVKNKHKDFLEQVGAVWEIEDSWHPDFEIDQISEIFPEEIPEKPVLALGTVNKFLTKQFEINARSQLPYEELLEPSAHSEIKGLSPAIAAKIFAKDRLLQSKRVSLVDSLSITEHNKGERLLKMLEIIKVLFSTHKTPSMFYNILTNKLKQLLNIPNKRIIQEDLQEILSNCPEFITLIPTNSGQVIRVNRQNDVKLSDLKQEMRKKYNLA